MAVARIKPTRGSGRYVVCKLPDGTVSISRRSNTLHMTKQDVANVFKAIHDAIYTTKEN
jgi:hypothetical protein